MNEQELKIFNLGYAAGLFDGEGCFTYGHYIKGVPYGCSALIDMTDLEPLKKFQEAVGMGKIYGPYERVKKGSKFGEKGKYKSYWQWSVGTKKEILCLFDLLEPFLCNRRKEKILEFKELYKKAEIRIDGRKLVKKRPRLNKDKVLESVV